jgi:predicted metal-dependent peptidase
VYNDDDRIGKLNATYKQLCRYRSVLLHEVVKLGYPRFVDDLVPTAAVGETPDGRLRYYWNRRFFDQHGLRDRVYICAHEALHVILSHPTRREQRDPELWNIACDIMVNTLLDTSFGIRLGKTTKLGNRLRPEMYGLNRSSIQDMTTEEIYDALPKIAFCGGAGGSDPDPAGGGLPGDDPGEGGSDEANDGGGDDDGDGSTSSGAGDGTGAGAPVDSHDFWDTITEEQIENVRRHIEKTARSQKWGRGKGGELAILDNLYAKPFPWQRLLRGRLTSVKKPKEAESWVRPNRKIYAHYPRILLPGAHDSESSTSSILSSIDTSGSMADEDIRDLASILMSLPKDEYETHSTWFDDGVYDAPDLTKVQGRGGTSFQKIELVARGELPIAGAGGKEIFLKRYPDVVVVMTDGYAPRPDLQHPERWVWIIVETGYDGAIKDLGCTVWNLKQK